jgi:hypothetical protein
MLGIEPRTSCRASCTLYQCATSVHSMVISCVDFKYLITENATRAARGTLGLVSDVRRGSRRAPCSGHQLEFPGLGCPFRLCNRLSLNAQVGCETLPASGVEAGTDCRCGCASLSDSESARLGRGAPAGAARPPGPFTWTTIYLTAVANLP